MTPMYTVNATHAPITTHLPPSPLRGFGEPRGFALLGVKVSGVVVVVVMMTLAVVVMMMIRVVVMVQVRNPRILAEHQ